MPPQQAYRLLDFVDEAFRFGAHRPALSIYRDVESARNIGRRTAAVKQRPKQRFAVSKDRRFR
jgi:hypothetical protein